MVYFGIYRNKNPGDEKMAEQKKKNALCIKTMFFIIPSFGKKRLNTNKWAYNPFEK